MRKFGLGAPELGAARQRSGRRAARAEAIDLHGVCLYTNRQIGRRIKEGMHTNLLNCINIELWFGGRASAELRAWGLGLGVPELGLETWALPT